MQNQCYNVFCEEASVRIPDKCEINQTIDQAIYLYSSTLLPLRLYSSSCLQMSPFLPADRYLTVVDHREFNSNCVTHWAERRVAHVP